MTVQVDPYVFWFVTGVAAAIVGWLVRLEIRSHEQQASTAALRLHVTENYASNAAVEKLANKLDEAIGILNRLVGRQEAAHGG